MKVFVSTPHWIVNGVCVYIANLVRGLRLAGMDASVLKTGIHLEGRVPELNMPCDLPVISFIRKGAWESRWMEMIAFLESQAPCVYLHNGDWVYACITPALSDRVMTINTVHNQDEEQMNQLERLGDCSNAVLVVSEYLSEVALKRMPSVKERIQVIHHGVWAPDFTRKKENDKRSLRMIYTGRIVQEQKRVHDFPKILEALKKKGVEAKLTLVGDGSAREALFEEFRERHVWDQVDYLGALSNEKTIHAYCGHDILLFPSAYEGLGLTVLEAMAAGCVPVAADSRTAVNEIIEDGVNGCFVPVGDVGGFAGAISYLHENPDRRHEMQKRAWETAKNQFSMDRMIQKHIELFEWCDRRRKDGVWHRPKGLIRRPPQLSLRARLGLARVWIGRWKQRGLKLMRLRGEHGQH